MKTLFTFLVSLMPLALSQAQSKASFSPLWSTEKCDAIDQVPDALVPGTILGRVLILSSDENWDIVLLMKIKENVFQSLPLGFNEGTDNSPIWSNGNLVLKTDYSSGLYHLYKSQQKILSLACDYEP